MSLLRMKKLNLWCRYSLLEYLSEEGTCKHGSLFFGICVAFFWMTFATGCHSRTIADSLAEDFRTLAAKNFSRYRTLNLSWETKWSHDYTFTFDGKEVENGRKKNLNTIRFSTMVPIVRLRKLSLYANVQYACYKFESCGDTASAIFCNDTYNHYVGGLNAFYYMRLFNRPLILSADISVDGWDKGWGKLQGRLAAVMAVKNTNRTNLCTGIMGMTLFRKIPVMPIITYWHRFNNPALSVEVMMPSQFYLRYQMRNQRISAGSSMGVDNFYLKTELKGVPFTCYYSDAVLKPEIHYEYIINRHFYLSVRSGVSVVMKGGLYTRNRKNIGIRNEEGETEVEAVLRQKRSPIPFFNVGVSYSLFK
ncbi:MAG: hypothetical protein ACI4B5_02190 [Bacteroidaceae bacterium]